MLFVPVFYPRQGKSTGRGARNSHRTVRARVQARRAGRGGAARVQAERVSEPFAAAAATLPTCGKLAPTHMGHGSQQVKAG